MERSLSNRGLIVMDSPHQRAAANCTLSNTSIEAGNCAAVTAPMPPETIAWSDAISAESPGNRTSAFESRKRFRKVCRQFLVWITSVGTAILGTSVSDALGQVRLRHMDAGARRRAQHEWHVEPLRSPVGRACTGCCVQRCWAQNWARRPSDLAKDTNRRQTDRRGSISSAVGRRTSGGHREPWPLGTGLNKNGPEQLGVVQASSPLNRTSVNLALWLLVQLAEHNIPVNAIPGE